MNRFEVFSYRVHLIILLIFLTYAKVNAQEFIIPEVPGSLTAQVKQKLEVQMAQLLLKKEWVEAEIATSNSNRAGKQLKDSLLMVHECDAEQIIVQKDKKAFENEIAEFGKLLEEQACIPAKSEGQSASTAISLFVK